MGNSVTAEQAHLIDRLGKRVILCPDRDTAGKELIEQALELGWEVSFPLACRMQRCYRCSSQIWQTFNGCKYN